MGPTPPPPIPNPQSPLLKLKYPCNLIINNNIYLINIKFINPNQYKKIKKYYLFYTIEKTQKFTNY
jgi:hypothetical protein